MATEPEKPYLFELSMRAPCLDDTEASLTLLEAVSNIRDLLGGTRFADIEVFGRVVREVETVS